MKASGQGFILSMQLLTTIPIKKQVPWNENTARAAVFSFPFVGVVIGALLMGQMYILFQTHVSPLFLALYTIFFTTVISGGLHVDGWMDISDAILSHRDREKKFEILKDSRVGAFAVLSLFFLFTFRFVFLYELLQNQAFFQLVFFLVVPVLARSMMALLLVSTPSATPTGMAVSFKQHMKQGDIWRVGVLFVFLMGSFFLLTSFVLILVAASLLFLIAFRKMCMKQFGGMTGDMLGAMVEGCETWLWFVLWLLPFFVTA
ncbi:adenosylcobinamide-GDP ribazoletransferase [Priestia taiwanensis]|uniref:Adenosylcobinamide-GDP ribazoletransferase n=1 Tax=Priestia taiwanensis TaxID=1347902 RepID=A0A917EKW6_9BACI|nr:adenosylcobinamide-GDP ribazoletransferase [Priestia taiwanensis]MBM7361593.1 adenosylcobinamide-GDP ribazoletransferase [Priestia taiwanensis]GGE55366.1 adenosylcobinamide-GDP ribazoletransferase [Priestia taiwanensis]